MLNVVFVDYQLINQLIHQSINQSSSKLQTKYTNTMHQVVLLRSKKSAQPGWPQSMRKILSFPGFSRVTNLLFHRRRTRRGNRSFAQVLLKVMAQTYPFLSLSGACQVDVAVSTSSHHANLSVARRFAVARLKLSGRRSQISFCPGTFWSMYNITEYRGLNSIHFSALY